MKMQIAAIGFNEKELEMYVSQLLAQGFESLSDVKKAEDGSFYQALTKTSKHDHPVLEKIAVSAIGSLPA